MKKDGKALFLIHQCVDGANFDKIEGAKTAKEAWDSLEKSHEGADKIKKVKLQTLRRKYELLQMEENESVSAYLAKILSLTNQMKACGKVFKVKFVIEKVLRTLTPKYDHIIVAIEESKDLENYKLEELQSSLEAHEQRLKERLGDSSDDQALQAHQSKKFVGQWSKNRRSKDKCQNHNCRKYGHFAAECRENRSSTNRDDEVKLTQGNDSDEGEHYLLMATIKNNDEESDVWYLDTGCSNHMIGKKDWFTFLDESTKSKVKFADNSAVTAEGIGKIMIQRKDGKKAYISNVLYVPKMKSKLISLGQLLEKGYSMEMNDGMLRIFDQDKNNILKAPLSSNRTFKIGIQVGDQNCFLSTSEKDSW
ncbi:unnamed protein product [Lupinus luteus]|uniref:Retrovirus-related Pol polyprotein from transposon TNT 1-94-like beta-barrel domain-containing protein n=1 Tax=Lupinus luteus TaxID=3873 RepID=A0AAV1VZH0_LUPLU